ncbi:hypothetical protein SDC9_128745 [bioreactor metagenome]|uniref:Uncharacterized protein n=1 Tax=bioreactor metagenome TaxID=1076179 RepID=A0A645CXY3_9ZZZZ
MRAFLQALESLFDAKTPADYQRGLYPIPGFLKEFIRTDLDQIPEDLVQEHHENKQYQRPPVPDEERLLLGKIERRSQRGHDHDCKQLQRARVQAEPAKHEVAVQHRQQHNRNAQRLMNRPEELVELWVPFALDFLYPRAELPQKKRQNHDDEQPDIQPADKTDPVHALPPMFAGEYSAGKRR